MKIINSLLTVVMATVTLGAAAESWVYPTPACETRNGAGYAVKIDGADAPVSEVRHSAMPVNIRWPGHQRELDQTEIGGMVRFAFSGKAKVAVTAPRDFKEVRVRPLSRQIRPQVVGRTVTFELTRPGAYSVEFDGIHRNLHVFADPPAEYRVNKSADTIVFGPGEHDAGLIELKSGQSLFIDEGAVVFGRVYARDADRIRIFGRGILDMSRIKEQPKPIDPKLAEEQKRKHFAITNAKRWDAIRLEFCDDVAIDGITIRDSLAYNIRPIGCRNLDIGNVKIVGNWRYNSDGIDMHNCENVRVHDCFVRTFDDSICVKGFDYTMNEDEMLHDGYRHDVFTNAVIERCTVWNDWGRSLEFGAETRAREIADITWRDCDLLRSCHAACELQNCDYADIHHIRFEDIRIDLEDRPQRSTYSASAKDFDPAAVGGQPCVFGSTIHVIAEYSKDGTRRGVNRDITLRNIRVTGKSFPIFRISGYDADHRTTGVVVDGFYWNGREISSELDTPELCGPFAERPRFVRSGGSDAAKNCSESMNGATAESSSGEKGGVKVLVLGDSPSENRAAIQREIDAMSAAGGGHLIYAYKASDVAITGGGTIDGNGPAFFGECQYRGGWSDAYKYGLKLFPLDREWFRPGFMVAFFMCRNIRIQDVTLANTPCWTCHIRCSDGVAIRGVTIDADRTIANSDGFSIDCTRNVTVEKCIVKTGDDGFAIRASCSRHATTNLCENIVVRDCDVWSCCNAVRLGVGSGTIRKVSFEDCRFHESGTAVAFTPAWVAGKRNVYIENIRFARCHLDECSRPVVAFMPNADARVKDAVFEDCEMESLLPVCINRTERAPVEGVRFVRCHRKTLFEGFKVRQDRRWLAEIKRQIRQEADLFATGNVALELEDCLPDRGQPKGVLILSFDDRNFDDWERAIPLFDRYGAHATFFVSGEIGNAVVRTMKKLRAHGHSIGLHGLHHADADREIAAKGAERYYEDDILRQKHTCDVSYVPVCAFGYPNGRRTEEADRLFFDKGFERVRCSVPGATPYDPSGVKQAGRKPLVANEALYSPAKDLSGIRLIRTITAGEAYHTDLGEILACLKRAAERKEVFAITSHGISPDAKDIHMKTEWLEAILKRAKELDLRVIGFDELPPPEDPSESKNHGLSLSPRSPRRDIAICRLVFLDFV